MTEKVIKHGTQTAYKRDRCRCDECKRWNRDSSRDYRTKKRGGAPRVYRESAVHGTRPKYVSGCRCEPCTAANRDYQREWARGMRNGVSMTPEWER